MKAGVFLSIIYTLCALGNLPQALAYESETAVGYVDPQNAVIIPAPIHDFTDSDGSRYLKFNAALSSLGIPAEAKPDFSEYPDSDTVPQDQVMAHLPVIDPENGLKRYLNFAGTNLSLFYDFVSNSFPNSFLEYSTRLATTGEGSDSEQLIDRIQSVGQQSKNDFTRPLAGLKVLIDPGHMGSADWDVLTGKYVTAAGSKVSEGQINLWTALVVANQLEAQGATVRLTRVGMQTVTTENYQTYDSSPYVNQYFYDSLDDWMSGYLSLSNDQVIAKAKADPKTTIGFSAQEKTTLFIGGADLHARMVIADDFQPDVFLDIHYDAVKTNAIQSDTNNVSAYVPGSFGKTETGSRYIKSLAVKQLLDVRRWNQSVSLATSITQAMSKSTNVPLLNVPSVYSATRVVPGVYTRNLYITARNTQSLMVYLECLHYDYSPEHAAMAKKDAQGNYHGTVFTYPARINAVAQGINAGILSYFQSL